MEKCRLCHRERPDFIADPSCEKGGYCEWEDENLTRAWARPGVRVTQLNGSKVTPMDVSWAEGNGIMGRRMHWAFLSSAIIEGFEVQPRGSSYDGFIDNLRIGNTEYLHVSPYPILMWSPGMPEVNMWLPHVPFGSHVTIEVRNFYGKIRPRGLILNP